MNALSSTVATGLAFATVTAGLLLKYLLMLWFVFSALSLSSSRFLFAMKSY